MAPRIPGKTSMPVRNPVCIDRDTTILRACRLMRNHHVEALVVIDHPRGTVVPMGIVCAQDIVTRIFATGLDPEVMTAGDIAWSDASPQQEARNIAERLLLLDIVDRNNVLPVLDGEGDVTGAVAVTDLLRALDEK
jgi:CBS domain-containing protein